ncbi:MAG: hypothetical protein K0U98_15530 [Deltaproteobacteria bacterium]|nr:hypothetical protein [Deltaproteobacteria bacterium]
MPPWRPGPDVATPDLPRPFGEDLLDALPSGCYFLQLVAGEIEDFKIDGKIGYDGTLRVDREGAASGDLYLNRDVETKPAAAPPWKGLDPRDGIPIFPRKLYRYYLRVSQIRQATDRAERKKALSLDFELFRFDWTAMRWELETELRADLRKTSPPKGKSYPRRNKKTGAIFFRGEMFNSRNQSVGKISLGHVSKFLRKATVQIFTQGKIPPPLCRCGGESTRRGGHKKDCISWEDAYGKADWQIQICTAPFANNREKWSRTQLHEKMIELGEGKTSIGEDTETFEQATDLLDCEWRSNLLCISKKEKGLAEMYDRRGDDLNGVPREGAALGAKYIFCKKNPIWGRAGGKAVMETPEVYFHIAVHEIAHTQGLMHNSSFPGFMSRLDHTAAETQRKNGQFPQGLEFSFSNMDCRRLQHFPDPWVRPGGVPFRHNLSQSMAHLEDHRETPPGLKLKIVPLSPTLPLGAPLRVTIELEASADLDWAPRSMNLRSGEVFGRVIAPSGTSRSFMTMVRDVDSNYSSKMKKGDTRRHDMTLLRGAQGPLLPSPGLFQVEVSVEWDSSKNGWRSFRIDAQTSILVMPPENWRQGGVALRILGEPETLPLLVLGNDLTGKGRSAIQKAMEDDVLRPHFGIVEAGRRAETLKLEELLKNPDPDSLKKLEDAIGLIDSNTVMTAQEVSYGLEMLHRVPDDEFRRETFGRVLDVLLARAAERQVPQEISQELNQLLLSHRDTAS